MYWGYSGMHLMWELALYNLSLGGGRQLFFSLTTFMIMLTAENIAVACFDVRARKSQRTSEIKKSLIVKLPVFLSN